MPGLLKKLWKDKKQILEGISNSLFIREEVEKVAIYREERCQDCEFYDSSGSSPKVVLKGKPACSICGCNIKFLTHSLSSKCSRHEIGLEPLWIEELTEEEEKTLPNDHIQPE